MTHCDNTFGYDEAGNRVPVVSFVYPQGGQSTEEGGDFEAAYQQGLQEGREQGLRAALAIILKGAESIAESGGRGFVLGFTAGVEEAPHSIRELARKLGVSSSTAHDRVKRFKSQMGLLFGSTEPNTEFADLLGNVGNSTLDPEQDPHRQRL